MPRTSGVDLRNLMAPIEDQGSRDTCVAFALTAYHEVCRYRNVALSEEDLYWRSRELEMPKHPHQKGITFETALAVLIRHGQVEESVWPYASSQPEPYTPPLDVSVSPRYTISAAQRLAAPRIASIQDFIERETLVAAGLRVYPNFMMAGKAPVRKPENLPPVGNHAIVVVGYHGFEDDPDGYFIIRNSYGTRWGDEGYGYISYEYFREHLLVAYVMQA